jgi:hypothetical protein
LSQVEELVFKFTADAESMRKDLSEIRKITDVSSRSMQRSLGDLAENSKKSFFSLNRVIETTAGVFLGKMLFSAASSAAGAVKNLAKSLISDGVKAAQAQEDAVNKLNSALRITGKFSEETSKDLQEFASALQRTSRFGDEVILKNMGIMQSLTNLSKDGLKQATSASLDMAAALGMDLSSASNLVAKAVAGQTSALTRYGIQVQKGATEAETFANVMNALNEKFGGAAAMDVKTFSGSVDQLGNTFGDLKEEIGFVVTQNQVVIAVISELEKIFHDLGGVIQDNREYLKGLVADGIITLADAIPLAVEAVAALNKGFEHSLKVINFLRSAYAGIRGDTGLQDRLLEDTYAIEQASMAREKAIAKLRTAAEGIRDRIVNAVEEATEADQDFNRTLASTAQNVRDLGVFAGEAAGEIGKLSESKNIAAEAGLKLAQQLLSMNELEKARFEELKLMREQDLISLEEFQTLQLEMVASRHDREQALLEEALEAKMMTEEEYAQAILELRRQQGTELTKLDLEGSKARQDIKEKEMAAIYSVTGQALSDLSTLSRSKNKELAQIGKAAAISETTIRTYQSATSAFAALAPIPVFGPGLAAAAASAAIVAGLANVAQIRGTPLQKGMTSIPGVGTADNFPAILAPRERVVTREQNEDLTRFLKQQERAPMQAPVVNVSVNVQGPMLGNEAQLGEMVVRALNEVDFVSGLRPAFAGGL